MKINKLLLFIICVINLQISGHPTYLSKFQTAENKYIYLIGDQHIQATESFFENSLLNIFKTFLNNQERLQKKTLILIEYQKDPSDCLYPKDSYLNNEVSITYLRNYLLNTQSNFIKFIDADIRQFVKILECIHILLDKLNTSPDKFNQQNLRTTSQQYYDLLNINLSEYLNYLNSKSFLFAQIAQYFLGKTLEDINRTFNTHKQNMISLTYDHYTPYTSILKLALEGKYRQITDNEKINIQELEKDLHRFYDAICDCGYRITEVGFLDYIIKNLNDYDDIILISGTIHTLVIDDVLQTKFNKISQIGLMKDDFDPSKIYPSMDLYKINNFLGNEKNCNNCYKEVQDKKRCGQCKNVYYCSANCQKIDWHKHKHICKKLKATENP